MADQHDIEAPEGWELVDGKLHRELTFADFSEVFPAPITLDIFNQFHYMEERTMRKHDPTNDFGDVKIGGYANSIGATFILRFN